MSTHNRKGTVVDIFEDTKETEAIPVLKILKIHSFGNSRHNLNISHRLICPLHWERKQPKISD